jgi:hypothetical protein
MQQLFQHLNSKNWVMRMGGPMVIERAAIYFHNMHRQCDASEALNVLDGYFGPGNPPHNCVRQMQD